MLLKILLVPLLSVAAACGTPDWRAGDIVSEKDTCFTAEKIPDSVFKRMVGKSFPRENSLIARDELRYLKLVHYNFDGKIQKGEMICSKTVAGEVLDIFRELYKSKYRIEQVRLIDEFDADDEKSMRANNSSAFNYRVIKGTNKLSKHARGLAVDINPLYNPCVKGNSVEPATAAGKYDDRSRKFPHKITSRDKACVLFKSRGWIWGGDWKSLKDWQHFEKK